MTRLVAALAELLLQLDAKSQEARDEEIRINEIASLVVRLADAVRGGHA